MNIKDFKELIKSIKKWPFKKIILYFFVSLIVMFVIAFSYGFFGETGKRIVGFLLNDSPRIEQPPKDLTVEQKVKPHPTINQHTEGDQSPIVNVGPEGKSTINYGSTTDKGAQE